MAIIVERFLACDTPGCNSVFGLDNKYRTAQAHREAAEQNGWRNTPMNEDFCPECVTRGKGKTKVVKREK